MSAPAFVSVEVERPRGRLLAWEDALCALIDPVLRERVAVQCLPMDERRFMGRIEYCALGQMGLSKVTSTKFLFKRSMTTPTGTVPTTPTRTVPTTPAPTVPVRARFISISKGSYTVVHRGRTCILTPGDWALIDTNQPSAYAITGREFQAVSIMPPPTSDATIAALFERGVARRWNGRTGLSRVLLAMVNDSSSEMRRLPQFSRRKLGAAITALTWDALREQIETSPVIGHRDERLMRVKSHIEAHIADPGLSVEQIAHACNISVRALHRLFHEDSAGSVSHFLWRRRLIRSAETLRDPSQARRSITDVCFSYGFNSSSHFSRLFKREFGVPPFRYRVGPEDLHERIRGSALLPSVGESISVRPGTRIQT